MRSLVRLSNVSPVLVDYPRYLHHQDSETAVISPGSCLHGVQLPTQTSDGIFGNFQRTSPVAGLLEAQLPVDLLRDRG